MFIFCDCVCISRASDRGRPLAEHTVARGTEAVSLPSILICVSALIGCFAAGTNAAPHYCLNSLCDINNAA